MQRFFQRLTIVFLASVLLLAPAAAAKLSKKQKQALAKIESAVDRYVGEANARGLIKAMRAAAKIPAKESIDIILKAYSRAEELPEIELFPEDRFGIYSAASSILATMEGPRVSREIVKAIRSHPEPLGRFLALTAAAGRDDVDAFKLSEEVAKKDKDPRVLQRAFKYLGQSKSHNAIQPLINRMLKIESTLYSGV